MKYMAMFKWVMLIGMAINISGCVALGALSYLDRGFYRDHGKTHTPSLYKSNDSCSVWGTCGDDGPEDKSSCSIWGTCKQAKPKNDNGCSIWGCGEEDRSDDGCGVWGCADETSSNTDGCDIWGNC